MLKKASSYFVTTLFSVLKRFPLASLSVFLSFLFLVLSNHSRHFEFNSDLLARASLQSFVAFPLMVAIQIFCENYIYKRTVFYKILLYISAITFNITYFFTLFTTSDKIELFRCLALFIIFTTVSMILLSYKNKNFSVNLIKISTNFFISCLYSLVLMLGLMGFFLITRILLFPTLDYDIMQDIMSFSYIFFAPMFFMAGIPDRYSNNDELKYPLILKFIIKFLAIPFSFGYMTILYLYFAKTMISLTIPNGVIVHIVIWFSIGCFIIVAYISSLVKESKAAVIYVRFIPKLLIPVLLFMLYSLYLRIIDYGITESRYFILITGIFILGFMIYASFTQNIKWKAVLSTVVLLILISNFTPLGAFTLSKLSQNKRFEEILKRNHMIVGGKIKPFDKISEKDKEELYSIFKYFDHYHSLKELKILPQNLKSEDYVKIFGFNIDYYYSAVESDSTYINYQNSEKNNYMIDSSECDFIILFDYIYSSNNSIVENQNYKSVYDSTKETISIYSKADNSLIYFFNLNVALSQKLKENRAKELVQYPAPAEALLYTDIAKSGISVTYRFNNISGNYYPKTDKYESISFSGMLLKVKLNR